MAKQVTREQAQRKKTQAVAFLERIGQSNRAQEFAEMSTEEYADHKGLRLSNPQRRRTAMAKGNTNTTTKADLQDQIDEAIGILDDAYQVESTREDLAEAISSALDSLRGETEDEDEDEDGDDDGNGDDLD
jgi:hypothetical protein